MKFETAQVDVIVGTYVASLDEDYDGRTAVVRELAASFDTTEPTIRGKLVSEGVYVGKPKAEGKSSSAKEKEDVLKALEAVMGVKLPSFKNASKRDLNLFWDRFVEMSDLREVG